MNVIHCTALVWGVLPSLDRGLLVPLPQVVDRIQDQTLPNWLPAQLDADGKLELSIVSSEAWAALLPFLREQQPPREFNISGNGLAYLVALATEGIQQLSEERD